jgi:flagellin FlaB
LKRDVFGKYAKEVANMHRGQRGMTGLETAIILIAFVTVAAVFGYAVLSAGLFSAERGKETVYAGLAQAKSNMELSGSVIVTASDEVDPADEVAETIRFTVRNAIAGTPIDLTPNGLNTAGTDTKGKNRCIISLTTEDTYYNNILWSTESIGDIEDTDNLLESGEQMEIIIDLADLGTQTAGTGVGVVLGPNKWFNIQVKPMLGSTMTIQRTLPAGLNPVMDDTRLF